MCSQLLSVTVSEVKRCNWMRTHYVGNHSVSQVINVSSGVY